MNEGGTRSNDVLDAPALASLRGPHAALGKASGRVVAYDPAVAAFAGLPVDPEAADWEDLARLVGPGNEACPFGAPAEAPVGWTPTFRVSCAQMIDTYLEPFEDPDAVELSTADLPEMLDLVARTRPGPFRTRTIEMGHYLGLRHDGVLVAMAGERMHPPGWTEISAVCTDPAFRGRGLGSRLIRAVAVPAAERGEGSFLHAVTTNAAAIGLYESLGFRVRREIDVAGFIVPR